MEDCLFAELMATLIITTFTGVPERSANLSQKLHFLKLSNLYHYCTFVVKNKDKPCVHLIKYILLLVSKETKTTKAITVFVPIKPQAGRLKQEG